MNLGELERSVEYQGEEYSPDLVDTLSNMMENIISHRVDNNKLIEAQETLTRAQEKKEEVNVVILQSLLDLQK